MSELENEIFGSTKVSGNHEEKKIRILAWGDYCCSTGFGTVMSNIMRYLHSTGKYEIDVIGINYTGDPYDTDRWPGNVWPARPATVDSGVYTDVYGRQRVLDLIGKGIYDVLFGVQDTFVLQEMMPALLQTQESLKKMNGPKNFKTVFYFPIDATPKPDWISDVVDLVDFPITYTKYARQELATYNPKLGDIPVIYHGTNTKDFFPLGDEPEIKEQLNSFRNKYFNGLADGRFLIMNLNRNQPRKDIIRSLMIIRELKDRGRDPLLYLHMQHADAGGNIFVMAEQLGLENEKDFVLPHPNTFSANQGLPIATVNLLYNTADMVLTTTLGEGWGLSITEGFSTKTPVVAPNNTSLTEMLAKNRGKLVDSGENSSAWIMKEMDNERLRPIMNVEKAADAIEEIMDGKLPDLEGAYKWATEQTWESKAQEFEKIIDNAATTAKATKEAPFMNRRQRRMVERQQRKGK